MTIEVLRKVPVKAIFGMFPQDIDLHDREVEQTDHSSATGQGRKGERIGLSAMRLMQLFI